MMFSAKALAYNPADPNLSRDGAKPTQDPISSTIELFTQVMSATTTTATPSSSTSDYSVKSPSLTQTVTEPTPSSVDDGDVAL